MTSSHRLHVYIAVAALLGIVDIGASQGPDRETIKNRTILVFDPTVDSASPKRLLANFVQALRNSPKLREGTEALAWTIREDMMAHPEPSDAMTFVFHRQENGDDLHRGDVDRWLENVRTKWESDWTTAHSANQLNRRASCLVSTLYCVSDFLKGAPRVPTEVFLISDLLEVCGDWGKAGVNVETAFKAPELPNISALLSGDEVKRLVSLQALDRMSVFVQPATYIRTPVQRDALQEGWTAFLGSLGLKTPPVFFAGIPAQVVK